MATGAAPWAQTYARCRRLASALVKHGVGAGDTVAVMAPNVPAIYEAHFAVPMTGAVLNTLNIRLDAEAIAFQLAHGEAKVLITDREFSGVIKRALALLERRPLVIDIDDPLHEGGVLLGEWDYEAFLMLGDPRVRLVPAGRRVRPDRPELHLWHDGQPEGRRHAPPRGIPERGVPDHVLGHACALGLSLDAADVPLQTAGASPGRWRPMPAPTSACAGWTQSWSSTRSGRTG